LLHKQALQALSSRNSAGMHHVLCFISKLYRLCPQGTQPECIMYFAS